MIYFIGIILTLFLSLILLTKKKTFPDKILFAWLCIITIHLTLFALLSSQKYLQFPYFLGIEIPLPLLHGPFLFLYTSALTSGRVLTRKAILHFIPFFAALISILPFFLRSSSEKILVYQNEGADYSTRINIIFWGIIISGLAYSIASLLVLASHKKKIKENYSYTEKINLRWLFNLIIGLFSIWLVVLIADDEYVFTAVVIYVLFVGYFGIKQVGIFTNHPPTEPFPSEKPAISIEENTTDSENPKYEKSLLSRAQFEKIDKALQQLMNQEKLFLTPELSLSMVAERLDLHPNTVSEVINRAQQKSFFEYINTMRVQEFKQRISKPENQQFTLLSIAHDCGFNSKTSFNRNFKQLTGKSPSEYLKEMKIELK